MESAGQETPEPLWEKKVKGETGLFFKSMVYKANICRLWLN